MYLPTLNRLLGLGRCKWMCDWHTHLDGSMAAASLLLGFQRPCLRRPPAPTASTAHFRGRLPVQLSPVFRHGCRRNQAQQETLITAVASAAPSTARIILQGRHLDITPAIKNYVVSSPLLTLWLTLWLPEYFGGLSVRSSCGENNIRC